MKRIIKSYTGSEHVFDFSDDRGFTCCMFAVLAGHPKKVTLVCSGDDEVYLIDLC